MKFKEFRKYVSKIDRVSIPICSCTLLWSGQSVVFIPAFRYNVSVVYSFDKGRTEGFVGAYIWTFERDRKPMKPGKCCLHQK